MYAFGDFVLDLQRFQLRRGDDVVPLEPKVFDVLRYLVEHHDRVATKQELLGTLWPDEEVTRAVLPTNISALRRALGQGRGQKTPIETVHGRGYRFSMPVSRSMPVPKSLRAAALRKAAIEDLSEDGEPLVGQIPLIEALERALSRSLSGQGQLCILRGETGIGKSRIAKHVQAVAHRAGVDVWTGACPDGVGTPPLWVWQEVLRSAKVSEGAAGLRRLLGKKASDMSPWLYELLDDNDDDLLLTSASKARPRLICLEDFHRADDASWQLLRLLAPHLEKLSVMVLAMVRSRDDLTVFLPVQRHIADLSRLSFCQRFQVAALSEPETHTLLDTLSNGPVPPALARTVFQKTSGNPLFVRELAEWIADTGKGDSGALSGTAGLSPPELVRNVLLRRVERLGEGAMKLLSAAAVVGTSFELACLMDITEATRDQAMEVLDAALRSKVVHDEGELFGSYHFGHELIRDTLYAELRPHDRRKLHLAMASWLTRHHPTHTASSIKDIATHFYRALPEADLQLSIDWQLRAVEECEREANYADAGRFSRWALDAARLSSEATPVDRSRLDAALERVVKRERDQKLAN